MTIPKEQIRNLRHDLRTHLSLVSGYTELMREELKESDHPEMSGEIKKLDVHSQILNLVFRQFFYKEGQALEQFDLDQFKNSIYGPLYRMIGDVQRFKGKLGNEWPHLLNDVEKLLTACRSIQDALEKHVSNIPSQYQATIHGNLLPESSIDTGRDSEISGKILLIDDDKENSDILAKNIEFLGHKVDTAHDGFSALKLLNQNNYDLVILDIVMPGMDGYQVLEKIKSQEKTKHLPVIVLSGLDEIDSVTRCLRLGAEDYVLKGYNAIIFRAKINSCLEKKRAHDNELAIMAELKYYQNLFEKDLAEAASYVRGFLPAKLDGPIATDYVFRPSKKLGGDFLDYHWLDEDHFAFYLLDVSGHGIGAALLSVSVANLLRSQLPNKTDLLYPNMILEALNRSFLMEQQNNMYFTMWYGVYQPSTRTLLYASAGAPPAILLHSENETTLVEQLSTNDLLIGFETSYQYELKEIHIPPRSHIYLFSDGVYEIRSVNQRMLSFKEFLEILRLRPIEDRANPSDIFHQIQGLTGVETFEDDFTLLEIVIRD